LFVGTGVVAAGLDRAGAFERPPHPGNARDVRG